MSLYLTSANQGSKEESCSVQVHVEAPTLAARSRLLLVGSLQHVGKSNRTTQSLVNHWPNKDNRSKTLFLEQAHSLPFIIYYHKIKYMWLDCVCFTFFQFFSAAAFMTSSFAVWISIFSSSRFRRQLLIFHPFSPIM